MIVYDNIEEVIRDIFEQMSTNEDFIKLMSNDSPTALTDTNTKTLNDLWDNKRLFLTPKSLDPNIQQGSYAFIYYNNDSDAGSNNIYQKDLYYKFVFLSHVDTWELENWKIRAYRLLSIVRSGLKSVELEGKGFRKSLLVRNSSIIVDDYYMGYSVSFEITGNDNC